MSLKDLKFKFRNGDISKCDYINEMHKKHKHLFEYAEFIKNTDIAKIEITDDFIVMISRYTGVKLFCDKNDKRFVPIEILNFDAYEKTEFEMVLKLIEEKFTVFDIGANIGWYSINISKAIKDVRVFAFEPVQETFEFLKKNIEMNNISNTQIFNFGFSNKERELIFYYDPENSGNASAANLSKSNKVKEKKCFVKRMDDFVIEKGLIVDFIKCDVEGAELMVFQGGTETIKKHKPIIYTEMLRKWSEKFNYYPNDVINLLSCQGYGCFVAKDDKLVEFTEMNDRTTETNFFFLHKEKHQSYINNS